MEPLRAGEVLLFEDGFRFLCDAACRDRFRDGERSHESARPPRLTLPPRRDPTPAPPAPVARPQADRSAAYRAMSAPRDPPPWLGLGAAGTGLLLGAFAQNPIVAVLSAAAVAIASSVALVRAWPSRREVGWLGWGLPPAGAILAAVSALLEGPLADPRLALAGASFAAAAVVMRHWLDAQSTDPVERVAEELVSKMPVRVRVWKPSAEWATRLEWEAAPATAVRAGQEVVVGEGEVLGVDGVVQAGEAMAYLHPSSRTAVRRRTGDAMLAGARVTEGEVRVLATRVGAGRALVRPASFGDARGAEAARLTRLAAQVTRWGGPVALAAALLSATLLSVTDPSLEVVLRAMAAVMLAAPLVAIRRASEAPYVAAAATAAERGIAFANARAVDRAGRTTIAALCAHGTITEGEPEVVEIHAVDDAPWQPLVSLVAGAEAAVEPHPIGHAILRFCARRGIGIEAVRRATLVPGRGLTALSADGAELVVGNRALLLDEGVSVAVADADAARAEERGQTVVFVGVEGRVRAVICLRDEDRLGARAAVQRLIDQGIEVVLLSGDHRGTVEALARPLDITHVKAELLPHEQAADVRRLAETGGVVATIGRPGGDDPALEAAQVPVVLGAAGAPEGERAIALTGDDVRDAAAALWLARAARRAAWRGTTVATLGGGLLVGLAALGLIAPVVAALLALAIDAYALPSAARLLRRIELRLPARG